MTEKKPDCETTRDMMGILLTSDISVPDLAAAREHLEHCHDCRKYLEKIQEDDLQLQDFAASHESRVSELVLQVTNKLPSVDDSTALKNKNWYQMTSTRSLAAVAAVVVFLVFFLQGTNPSFDAWAEVLETVRNATTSQFRLRNMDGGSVESRQAFSEDGTSHRTYEDGRLVEALFVDFNKGEMVYLAYPLKMAVRMKLSEAMVQDNRERDPAETFNFLQEYEYEKLGDRRIDGEKAVGVRITDARFLAEHMERAQLELWVDPETKLPLRFDVEGEIDGGRKTKHIRFHDFRWNEPLPADEFRPDIPKNFDLHEGMELAVDEEHCIEALRLFSKIVGHYPSTLAYETLKVELWDSSGARKEDVGTMVARMFQIRLASTFFGDLVHDEKEVVYFGHSVRCNDAASVLMRWKIGDDQYRVVWGDLQASTVTGAQLLQLESQ